MLFVPLTVLAAEEPALPPPTDVQDTPAARETVEPEHPPVAEPQLKGEAEVRVYKQEGGAKVEEYSIQGRVYMIHVQPPGGLPDYYLYDKDGTGVFVRLPGGYKPISPPQWVIKRF